MEQMSADRKKEIVEKLGAVGAILPCPRCGNHGFSLLDGYFNQPVQSLLGGIVIGGPSVPSAVVVCNRCGYMAQHALGALGLLTANEEAAGEGKKGAAK